MKIENANYYDEYLLSLIPNLEQYQSKHGSEGRAYFIDDKFVVKEILNVYDESNFSGLFEDYCEELQSFADQCYKTAKIYSCVKIPNTKNTRGGYIYYILEEYMPGRQLYFEYLSETYELCKHLCSKEEFTNKICNQFLTPLSKEIYKIFVNDYVQINEMIESMNENEIEKFLMTIFDSAKDKIFIYPDIYNNNLIVNSDNINLIDYRCKTEEIEDSEMQQVVIGDLIVLMKNNYICSSRFQDLLSRNEYLSASSIYCREIQDLFEKNKKILKQIFIKAIKFLKKRDDIILTNQNKKAIKSEFKNILGEENSHEVIEMI